MQIYALSPPLVPPGDICFTAPTNVPEGDNVQVLIQWKNDKDKRKRLHRWLQIKTTEKTALTSFLTHFWLFFLLYTTVCVSWCRVFRCFYPWSYPFYPMPPPHLQIPPSNPKRMGSKNMTTELGFFVFRSFLHRPWSTSGAGLPPSEVIKYVDGIKNSFIPLPKHGPPGILPNWTINHGTRYEKGLRDTF